MNTRERILKYIESKGISKYRFYKDIGLSNGYLDKEGNVGSDICEKISYQYKDLSIEWLITGKGEMLKMYKDDYKDNYKESIKNEEKTPAYNINHNNIHIVSEREAEKPDVKLASKPIYLYDVSAAAGFGSFDEMISTEKVIGTYIVPDFRNVDWMIYVKGSSMYPKYSSGDIIACRVLYESRFIQWNKVYVIATREQGVLVKRIDESDKEDCLLAVSDNPSYKPFYIPKDEILGIALVVGVIRME